jgi:hypothetical protein
VFLVAASIFFEARGMPRPSPRPASGVAAGYLSASAQDRSVQAALQFALRDRKQKNRTHHTLLAVLSAERQVSAGENFRFCLSLDRHGRTDTARVVVHRNPKDRWSVTLWAWGGCKENEKQKTKNE